MTTKSPPRPHPRHRPLDLTLHPGQREVNRSKARFRVVACGRQWGKTRYAAAWAFKRAAGGQRGWWVAPDANIADVGWEQLRTLAAQLPDVEIRESMPRTIKFPGGGWLQVKGAHLPGKLRARTLHFVVIDEAAFIEDARRWYSELRPTLAINKGDGLFISTFNGENWFYDLYELGQSDDPEWESWRKPSSENPYLDPVEIEAARKTTPQAEFEQEWLANPLIYVGAVFPGEKVQEATERECAYREDLPSYAGLDWGYTNPTVLELCQEDGEGRVFWLDERSWYTTQIDTRIQRIVELCREYGVEGVWADAASPGDNAKLKLALMDADLPTEVIAVGFGQKLRNGEIAKNAGIKTRRWYLENDLEAMGDGVPELIRTTKRYHYKEGTEDVEKLDDHHVDAATAFYVSRRQFATDTESR